jgi:hypothetical protein
MSINYSLVVRNNRLQQVLNAIDGGAAAGVLRILDGSANILSSITLLKPSAAISAGILTFNGLPLLDPSAARSGTAILARIEDSAGNQVITGLTVGMTSSSDLLLSSNAIAVGQQVSLTAATITGN